MRPQGARADGQRQESVTGNLASHCPSMHWVTFRVVVSRLCSRVFQVSLVLKMSCSSCILAILKPVVKGCAQTHPILSPHQRAITNFARQPNLMCWDLGQSFYYLHLIESCPEIPRETLLPFATTHPCESEFFSILGDRNPQVEDET